MIAGAKSQHTLPFVSFADHVSLRYWPFQRISSNPLGRRSTQETLDYLLRQLEESSLQQRTETGTEMAFYMSEHVLLY